MTTGRSTRPRAVVVGGSIAGISCANSLIQAGWDVMVIEKSRSPQIECPTGAGLCLDLQAQKFIESWIPQPELFHYTTLPIPIDLNTATDCKSKLTWTLARDENLGYRAAYWADLHGLLYRALPPNIVLWGHLFLSFGISDDKASVKVKVKVQQTNEVIEIVADLLIAADGSKSAIRKYFLPDLKLRYSGYSAWRGMLDFSGNEKSDIILDLRKAYPELGKSLIFDLGPETHCVLYELQNKNMNWAWYITQPEPELEGDSVTMNVSTDMIGKMHNEAEETWVPALARVMKETTKPIINVIYDCEPLTQFYWDNVVLVGDAAHPILAHGARSTSMSILDAGVLGKCLEKWGVDKLGLALKEYQSVRLPVCSKQVLHSRILGGIKQGFPLMDHKKFDPKTATPEECQELQQRTMPFFNDAPESLENPTA